MRQDAIDPIIVHHSDIDTHIVRGVAADTEHVAGREHDILLEGTTRDAGRVQSAGQLGPQEESGARLYPRRDAQRAKPRDCACHSRMGPQLWHVGAVQSPMSPWEPDAPMESPSGLHAPGHPLGEAMSDAAIADTIAGFAKAAGDAKRLGFDTVELHGAHGYLIDQFFWAPTNARGDRYGGASIRERSRFAREIIAAVREEVGPDFPVILRISQWKQQDFSARVATSPEEMSEWLQPLVDAGLNVLHCSQRRFWEPEFPELDGEKGLNFAGWAKKLTGAVTISVGSVGLSGDFISALGGEASTSVELDQLTQRMEQNEFDMIAVGRALISDPLWAKKIRNGESASLKGFDSSALVELI
jgi:2,4-dienoyl-CoA reductase-like NADH-dependent reductase (Old Yellow Enzyme family)